MTDQASSYTMGYSDEFRQLLNRRSMETHAAHLLPHLKPGLRVLDFGCGPGTISVGLAGAVDPGEVHGVDMEESQIDLAPRRRRIRRAFQRHSSTLATSPRCPSRTTFSTWPTAMPC